MMDWERAVSRGQLGVALGVAALLAGCGAATPASAPEPVITTAPEQFPTTSQASPTPEVVAPPQSSAPVPAPPVSSTSALSVLGTLRVAGRGPKTGYSRAEFGQAWADVDRNGCDTRNDILQRDLTSIVVRSGSSGCVVSSGRLADPYTGTTVIFVRGASKVDIDHVIALSNAWQSGAARWTFNKRIAIANDPLNLLAVDSSQNRQKGDGDAATWLPDNRGFWCQYAARQIGVKSKYGLSITSAERDALTQVLQRCPSQKVITGGGPTSVSGFSDPTANSGSSGSSSSGTTSGAGLDPRFGTCSAAKAAGFGPYYRGRDGEYSWYRDRDSDGAVCE